MALYKNILIFKINLDFKTGWRRCRRELNYFFYFLYIFSRWVFYQLLLQGNSLNFNLVYIYCSVLIQGFNFVFGQNLLELISLVLFSSIFYCLVYEKVKSRLCCTCWVTKRILMLDTMIAVSSSYFADTMHILATLYF